MRGFLAFFVHLCAYGICVFYVFSRTFLEFYNAVPVDQTILKQEVHKTKDCFQRKIRRLDDFQLWDQFETIVNDCTPRKYMKNINQYENLDESKFFRTPISNHNCTVVTLGVGRDVAAERKLKTQHPQCKFVGADPVQRINEALYREIGDFHEIAVGAENGTMNTLVYRGHNYTNESVPAVDLPHFLKDMVETTVIDLLLIDVEYGEYEMFEYFLGKKLEKIGITICQINMEVHVPKDSENHKQKFAKFIRRMTKDGRFHFVEGTSFYNNKRLFFTRIDHPNCL